MQSVRLTLITCLALAIPRMALAASPASQPVPAVRAPTLKVAPKINGAIRTGRSTPVSRGVPKDEPSAFSGREDRRNAALSSEATNNALSQRKLVLRLPGAGGRSSSGKSAPRDPAGKEGTAPDRTEAPRPLSRVSMTSPGFEAKLNRDGSVELTPPEDAEGGSLHAGTLRLVAFGKPVSVEVEEDSNLDDLAKNLKAAGFNLEPVHLGNGRSWSPHDFEVPITVTPGKQLDPSAIRSAIEQLSGGVKTVDVASVERMAQDFGFLPQVRITRSSNEPKVWANSSDEARESSYKVDPGLLNRFVEYLNQRLAKSTIATGAPNVEGIGGSPAERIARAVANFSTRPKDFDEHGQYAASSQLPVVVLTGPSGDGAFQLAKRYADGLHAAGKLPTSDVIKLEPKDLITDRPWTGQAALTIPTIRNTVKATLERGRGKVLLIDVGAAVWGLHGEQSLGGRLGGDARVAWQTIVDYGKDHPGEIAVVITGYPDEVAHFAAYDQWKGTPAETHNPAARLFDDSPHIAFGNMHTPPEQMNTIVRRLLYVLRDGEGREAIKSTHPYVHLAVGGGSPQAVEALVKNYAKVLADNDAVGKWTWTPDMPKVSGPLVHHEATKGNYPGTAGFLRDVRVVHINASDLATTKSASLALAKAKGNVAIVDYPVPDTVVPSLQEAMKKDASTVFVFNVGGSEKQFHEEVNGSPLLSDLPVVDMHPEYTRVSTESR
jgi:hypothetical protein